MRRLWTHKNWDMYFKEPRREGIRLRFEKDVCPEIREECIQFVQWLRKEYQFPMRVVIYVKSAEQIKAMNGEMVSATFFGPYDLMQEPYIKVATGDYEENAERWGKEDALRANLCSIAHELTHYYQWIKRHEEWASGKRADYFERQALYYAEKIVEDYEEKTNDFFAVRDGFVFAAIHYPWDRYDAIVIQDEKDGCYQETDIPVHTEEEYIRYIKEKQIKSAEIRKENLSFLKKCPSLRNLSIYGGKRTSIEHIEELPDLQCLFLSYARNLSDISALEKVKKTLKLLYIDHCPKIEDYTVLEKLENLQTLMIYGNNKISDIHFIREIKSLKRFWFSVNIADGDLTPCLELEEAACLINRKHHNLKEKDLPKNDECSFGSEEIDEWMRAELY